MSHPNRTTPLLLLCLLAPLPPASIAVAQDQGQPQSQGQGGQQPGSAAELVTDYLERDIFLRPGVGLEKVRIGISFDRALQQWGPPTSKSGNEFIGHEWTYDVAGHTRITLKGRYKVEAIRVAGGVNSPYLTTEGASFGMARHQLATIYGPEESDSSKVEYDDRGIGFKLDQGQVSEIRIFPPD